MTELTIDNLLSKAKNKFLLVNAAAGRAKQVSEGSLPYVDNFDPTNPVITALREIAAGKINIRVMAGPTKKTQELLMSEEEERPSALERLAREGKKAAAPKKKEKKKK
ncbi:MAG: DNA-directed RNA polymerase subunit omega [Candidatus Margulisbacteria bacterium]|nr:DNA-directed RNA polymerase subunit omega [Candidatus Margulisiibacteriota bacterium]